MNGKVLLIGSIFLAFTAYTIWAVLEVGYVGLLMNPEPRIGGFPIGPLQIGLDLIIMAVVALGWVIRDARKLGINPWPYVLITLPTGSIGVLLYLLRRNWNR